MRSPFKSLTIKNLTEKQTRVIRKPTTTRPIIRLVEENGIQGVVKDFSVNGFIYRNIIGRFLLWREIRAYQKLKGMKGIPVFYRKIGGLALVISKVKGKDLGQLSEEEKPDLEFFQRLTKLIQECHRHGIAHCDLKRSSNIIIDEFGNPYIVDWAAAILEKEFIIYPFKMIYRRFIEDDLKAVTKIKMRYCPEGITCEEKQNYMHRSIVERTIRAVRDVARKCLQKIA